MAAKTMCSDLDDEIMPNLEEISDDEKDQDEEWDEWIEDESICECLFCDETFNSLVNHFQHCNEIHNFNIAKICQSHKLDTYGYIKLINYIREKKPLDKAMGELLKSSDVWMDDEFLIPPDPNDPLLRFDVEEDIVELQLPVFDKSKQEDDQSEWKSRCFALENELSNSERALSRALEDLDKLKLAAKEFIISNSSIENNSLCNSIKSISAEEDDSYFSSYGHFGIHAEMLQDTVRTESYRDFMYSNKNIFEGKTVLDVGCGTGILSMFAAKAGAKQVIAVDQSDVIYQAIDIVKDNNLDNIITLVKGKVEEINIPVKSVDIIISEWMGYFLLFESMLDTVLYARDKWLSPGGTVFPDGCSILLTVSSDPELYQKNLGFWDNVYGFKMSCMKTSVRKETSVQVVKKEYIVADPVPVKEIQINKCQIKDLDFKSTFCLKINHDSAITAFVSYFDVFFNEDCENSITFSTGPFTTPTHWKQTVLLLEKPQHVKKGDVVEGKIVCKKNPKDPRSLLITLTAFDNVFKYEMD